MAKKTAKKKVAKKKVAKIKVGTKRPKREIRNLLKNAARKEKEAQRLYARFAKQVDDPSAQALLLELSKEEAGHASLLTKAAAGASRIPDTVSGIIVDLHIAEFLKMVKLNPKSSLQDVLIYALKRELQAAEAYSALARSSRSVKLRKLCQFLAREEKKHKVRLERLYDEIIYREN